MPRRIILSRHALHYRDGLVLHTASSGSVPALDELRLVVEEDGAVAGIGASRINIAYLSGLDAENLATAAQSLVSGLPWHGSMSAIIAACDRLLPPAPLRMLVEMAVRDVEARLLGVPMAALLGGTSVSSLPTNQTLFWTDDETMLARARAYLDRGFVDLKLRVGVGSVEDDLRRLAALRQLAPEATLSADANGQWTVGEAQSFIAGAMQVGLASLEQPLPKGDRSGLASLSGIPVMLDEEIADEEDVSWLAASHAVPLAHLKLAKLGGLDRLISAARTLHASGIGVMIGQMNEGLPSTLAAAHAAMALGITLCELYGADGLVDDPCGTLRYEGGRLYVLPGPGLGITHIGHGGEILWEHTA